MDRQHVLYFLLAWKVYVNMMMAYTGGFFFFNFILRRNSERQAINERALARYELRRDVIDSLIIQVITIVYGN